MAEPALGGKVAVITGGSGAIGTAIASALAAAGATAVSFDVAAPTNSRAAWIPCDVRSDDSVSHAVSTVQEQYGRIDIAVHAAGISRDAVVWKLDVDDWDMVQHVNLRGAFFLLRHCIPLLRQNGGGRIILIGSINGSRGKFGTAAYSASKAGLLGLAKTVARETGRFAVLTDQRHRARMGAYAFDGIGVAGSSEGGIGGNSGGQFPGAVRCCRGGGFPVRQWREAHHRGGVQSRWRTVLRTDLTMELLLRALTGRDLDELH
jgi:3-oxoacyl-[acyl-carrier protein] reductase